MTSGRKDGDKPATNDATVNRLIPPRKSRFWPYTSPARPLSIRNPANVRPYAPTIHWLSANGIRRSVWIDGSATKTIEKSITSSNPTARTRARIIREWDAAGSTVDGCGRLRCTQAVSAFLSRGSDVAPSCRPFFLNHGPPSDGAARIESAVTAETD